MLRFRQSSQSRNRPSSERIWKEVTRKKSYLHTCPKCGKEFPSNHFSFGRSMGTHMKFCNGIQTARGVEGTEDDSWEDNGSEDSHDCALVKENMFDGL